jgi:serine/threonine protein kinase
MIAGVADRGQPAPTVLGKYRLIAELGRGGMAEVFLALVQGPASFNKLMVIKRLRPHLAEEEELLQMFLDEARLAAKLSHPNVVQTIEVGEEKEQYFISMEYLEGQPLNRILRRCRRSLTTPMVVHILCAALDGLQHAHELTDFDGTKLRVVHRDATPHNIFVTYDGQVKVVDFGIAKAAISVAETRTGVLKGKVSYMAPEQARGEEQVDRRADLFSIGCCLWEGLTGQRVWKGKGDVQILNAIMGRSGGLPSPCTIDPTIDARLAAICMKALAFERDERHQTAIELRRELDAYLESIADKTTLLDVSAVIADHFADERDSLREIIERQVKQAADIPASEYADVSIPRLGARPQSLASVPRMSAVHANEYTPITASGARPRGDILAPRSMDGRTMDRRSVEGQREGEGPINLPMLGAALVCVAAIIVFVVLMRDEGTARTVLTPPAPSVSATATPNETTAPSDTKAARIEITVDVKPDHATIHVDGVLVAGNPFTGGFPSDGSPHLVVASAPGYVSLERSLVFDRTQSIALVLSAQVEVAVRPINTTPLPGNEAATKNVASTDVPTAREIDVDNPYR